MNIAVALLQGALGGAILVILVFLLIVGAVVAASVFGGALGGEGTSPGSTEAPPILPPGTILGALGLGFAWFAAYYGSSGMGFVGIMLGAMAYYRGARVLGGVVSVISFATLIIGHYVGDQLAQFSF